MEIAHQLPGRMRVRIPALTSDGYRRELVERLSNDERIAGQRISAASNSLIVSYDPLRIQTEDILSLLSAEKPSKEPVSRKKPASKIIKAGVGKKASASTYFKPPVSTDVQEEIRKIIGKENPQKPLSDGKISELLKEGDIEIARRTVAKYREMLGIPSSNNRRKQGDN